MLHLQGFLDTARSLMKPLLGLGLLCYMGYHLIQGDRGIRSWMIRQQELEQKTKVLDLLQREKDHLDREIMLLRDETLDAELLGEYLLKVLHYTPSHDWMILIHDSASSVFQEGDAES